MNKWFGVMPLSAALFYRNVKVKEKIKLIIFTSFYGENILDPFVISIWDEKFLVQ